MIKLGETGSPGSALLPVFGGRVPLLKFRLQKKSWYSYSNLATGGPRRLVQRFGLGSQTRATSWAEALEH